jgi:hypothetical protein
MEMVDPFGWHGVTAEKLKEIRQKLGQLEGSTWRDILVRDSKYNHFISPAKLCKEARDRLRDLRLDDTDVLLTLRLSGKERVWGILDVNILLVLWWDPEHLVYPVEKLS